MKKLLSLLSIVGVLFLSGCIPAALVIGATVGGAVIYDQRSVKTIIADKDAGIEAINKINGSPDMQHCHIVVSVFNHVMLLAGQTPTEQQREIAYQLASQIPNVSRIYNEITIERASSMWRRSDDALITAKVKSAMLIKKTLESTQIKVITENGVVYLLGIVSHKQAELATDVARRIAGVKKVVKVFQYPQ